MVSGRVDHVAIAVPDVDAAAAELKQLFGIEMHAFDVPAVGMRVAFCDEGFELVQATTEGSGLEQVWAGPLAAIGVRVDDLEQARQAMAAQGCELTSEIETPGGVRELFYAKGLAGLPVTLTAHGDQGFATAIGATGETYEPTVVGA